MLYCLNLQMSIMFSISQGLQSVLIHVNHIYVAKQKQAVLSHTLLEKVKGYSG